MIDHKWQPKRLTCCDILRSEIPSRIKVSFENIVSDLFFRIILYTGFFIRTYKFGAKAERSYIFLYFEAENVL